MRKRFRCTILFLSIIFSSMTPGIKAQEAYDGGLLENFGVSAKIGTYGPGIDFHTSLLPNLKARVGFNYLSYNNTDEIYFDADNLLPGDPRVLEGNITDAKLKFSNANVLLDFYPKQSGIFCITAGLYMGSNKITAEGKVDDYKGGQFEFEDIIISPEPDGTFGARLKLGNTVKPYLGIGIGRTIPKSRVSCRLDLGVVYQGKYKIESDNVSKEGIELANEKAADFDFPDEILKWWPKLSFSLIYRIK